MIFQKVYFALCVIITIVLTSMCIYQYQLDSDVTNIQLRKFHETDDDIYPSITLCDEDPFRFHPCFESTKCVNPRTKEELEILENYKSYILGQEQNFNDSIIEALEKIDYDNKTIALSDFIDEMSIDILSETSKPIRATYNVNKDFIENNEDKEFFKKYSDFSNFTSFKKVHAYVSARNGRYKCFPFDTPSLIAKRIGKITIRLQANQDSDMKMPTFNLNQVQIGNKSAMR